MAKAESQAELIREYVRQYYFEPARTHGQKSTRIIAGEVHAGLRLRSRVSTVCKALRSKELLRDAGVKIVHESGPLSGNSMAVEITYEFLHKDSFAVSPQNSRIDSFLRLRGVTQETFHALGGGEKFIKLERKRFYKKEGFAQGVID